MRFLRNFLILCLTLGMLLVIFYGISVWQSDRLHNDLASTVAQARRETPIVTTEATVAPTDVPTATPTATATAAATPVPTPEATVVPTTAPTGAPTATATATETPVPTSEATVAPTAVPTESPTATATATETPVATPVPTPEATVAPTETPTVAPTATATATETPVPTPEATVAPTAAPTGAPTATATPVATPVPTPEATVTPAATDVPSTTYAPSVTSMPTATPTCTPTATPVCSSPTPTPTLPPEVEGIIPDAPAFDDPVLASYAELAEQNPDMIGWVLIEGTRVDYPVMFRPEDKNFYLHRNFNKKYALDGIPFMDERCDPELPSDNLIIYGHNMRSGAMFNTLQQYVKEEFWNEHPLVHFDTLTERGTYEIFAVIPVNLVRDMNDERMRCYGILMTQDQLQIDSLERYVKRYAARHRLAALPRVGDEVLTLSTCTGFANADRLVVMARRLQEGETPAYLLEGAHAPEATN